MWFRKPWQQINAFVAIEFCCTFQQHSIDKFVQQPDQFERNQRPDLALRPNTDSSGKQSQSNGKCSPGRCANHYVRR